MKAYEKSSGVYQITCTANGQIYIGSAYEFNRRWNHHKLKLRKGEHDSKYMQNSWSKYGAEAFEFKILVICEKQNVLTYEQTFLDALKPAFNTCKIAGSAAGVKHSGEVKKRMSEAQRTVRPKYEWEGEMLCLSDIAERAGIDYSLLMARVMTCGKTPQEALVMGERRTFDLYEYEGRQMTLHQWSREFGEHPARLMHYIKQGMNIKQTMMAIGATEKRISFSELCRLNGANLQTSKSRVSKGMGVMQAITLPAKNTNLTTQQTEVII